MLSERFSSDRVTTVLEWTLSSSLIQYPQLLQNVTVSIVPDSDLGWKCCSVYYIGNTSVQLTLLYNSLYNVSIVQPATCEQLTQAALIDLKYSKFDVIYHRDNSPIANIIIIMQASVSIHPHLLMLASVIV